MAMPMPTLTRDDYDGSIHAQVDRARAADLGDVGLPGHRVAVAGRPGGRGALRAAEVQHGAGRRLARRLEPRRPHELPGPTAPAQPGDSLARPARGPRRWQGSTIEA
jgi:hypothetical protein